MDVKFKPIRVIALIAIIVLLAFVYSFARDNNSAEIGGLKNLADQLDFSDDSNTDRALAKGAYVIIEDPDDDVSVNLRDSVELALASLGYAPIYTTMPTAKDISSATEGIIVTRTYLNDYDTVQALLEYAQNGGLLIFAIRPEVDEVFKSIYQQLGIYEHYYYKDAKGFHAAPGLLSDGTYDVEDDWIYNSMIELHVTQDCVVLAENNDGTPLIWYLEHGQGNILVMNNSLMTYKSSAGLMLSLIARVKGKLMYPVVNAKAFALESFPLPTSVNSEFINKYYLRSGQAFLRDLWWPSMVGIASRSQIRFTAGFLTEYASEMKYSSGEVLIDDMDFDFYSKEIARNNGEIAFTGFNQKPLYFSQLKDGMRFVPWSNYDTAYQRTKEALDFYKQYMPTYNLFTFLPTEQLLDEQGYKLIKEVFPEIKVICGDFIDKTLYYQNFGVDENGIIQFPVISKGFLVDDMERWNLINTVTTQGIIFHSCDISELMLEVDAEKTWNKISEDFSKFCSDYIAPSPLDSLTITQAAERLKKMSKMKVNISYQEASVDIDIENMPPKAYFMLLSFDGKPKNMPGITCTEIHKNKYLITTDLAKFTLELEKGTEDIAS